MILGRYAIIILLTLLVLNVAPTVLFAKKARQVRMRMIIIALRSGDPDGKPESTTLLTLLPVLL
ncbi:hypothetical protein D4T62_00720 [Salmonella enterica subsp. enterica]|nr:hypothetical protein [Salmonella enterica subsp. enterica]